MALVDSVPVQPSVCVLPAVGEMPTIAKLAQGAMGLKVKELPGYVSKFATENWTVAKTSERLGNWLHRYKVEVRTRCVVTCGRSSGC